MLEVFYQTVGIASENTYVVVNEKKEALIIDPGAGAPMLIHWIKSHHWQPQAILLTHCHFDHIESVDELRDAFGIEAYVHHIEADYLSDPNLNLSANMPVQPVAARPAEHVWQAEDMKEQQVGSFHFRVAHIPGHSPGHVVYIFENQKFVIAGDTLFQGSIGRTDLYLGDYHHLINGIKTHLYSLPDDTTIYPGHGQSTTIKFEKRFNPYTN